MEKAWKIVGVILLAGVIVFGALYLINISGIANNLNPNSLLVELIGGFQAALNGIQASISGMFSNFTR